MSVKPRRSDDHTAAGEAAEIGVENVARDAHGDMALDMQCQQAQQLLQRRALDVREAAHLPRRDRGDVVVAGASER